MNSHVELNLALILLLPWYAIPMKQTESEAL